MLTQGNRLTRRPATVVNSFSAMLKLKCSKPCVFHIFHFWEAFSKLHFVLRGPIQNSKNAFSLRRDSRFFTLEKKVWNLTFEVTISILSQSHAGQQLIFELCHKHFGSSSKMEEEMAALWRHWKLRAHCQRFSLVPS